MALRHLFPSIELAARWNISHRTLERWRYTGEGPNSSKSAPGHLPARRCRRLEAKQIPWRLTTSPTSNVALRGNKHDNFQPYHTGPISTVYAGWPDRSTCPRTSWQC